MKDNNILGLTLIAAAVGTYFWMNRKESYKPPKGSKYGQFQNLGRGVKIQAPKFSSEENKIVNVGKLWQKDWSPRPNWFLHKNPQEKIL